MNPTFFEQIAALLVGGLAGINDPILLEKLAAVISTGGNLQRRSLEFDAAVSSSGASVDVGEGLLELAKLLSDPRNLDTEKKNQINAVIRKIVDIPDKLNVEEAAENFFMALLDGIDATQELADYIASLQTTTPVDPGTNGGGEEGEGQ